MEMHQCVAYATAASTIFPVEFEQTEVVPWLEDGGAIGWQRRHSHSSYSFSKGLPILAILAHHEGGPISSDSQMMLLL